MKRFKTIYLLLLSLCLVGMTQPLVAQSSKTIASDKAGSLSSKLTGLEGVTDLTITGIMDATDLAAIAKALPDLLRLDLEQVSFKKHLDPYDPYGGPSADCFPFGLNGKMKSLQELILPSSITKITGGALFGLQALTKLTCPTAVVPAIEGWEQELTSSEIYAQCTLYVQEGLVNAFKQSNTWAFHQVLPIPKPFEADLSLTVATSVAFTITVGAEGEAVTVHYPDGFQESKVGAKDALMLTFTHTIDPSKVTNEKRILISAPTAIALKAERSGVTACEFIRKIPLQELALRSEGELTALDLSSLTSLTSLILSNCAKLTTLQLPTTAPQLKTLQLPGTAVRELTLTPYTALEELDLVSVGLSEIDLTGLTQLRSIALTDNELTALDLPQSTRITTLYCGDNKLTLDKLPTLAINGPAYVYAPQAPMSWGKDSYSTDDAIDLSHLTQLQGVLAAPVASVYACFDAKSKAQLREGIDYKVLREGVFQLLAPHADGVFFTVTTSAFPAFTGDNAYQTEPIVITQGTSVCAPTVSNQPLQIEPESKGVTLTTQASLPYALYDLSGACHYRGTLQAGRTDLPLASGSYLLVYRLGDRDESVKFVVTTR